MSSNTDTDRKLRREADLLADLTACMKAAVEQFAAEVETNFESESAGDQPFAPLAPSTIAERERLGFGASPILQRTGEMRAGATADRHYSGNEAEVGPDPETPAAYHMSLAPRSKIPLRDFYALSEAAEERIEEAFVRAFEDLVGR